MRLLPLILLPLATVAVAADRGPGIPGERDGDATIYRAGGFDAIGLGGAATVDVRVGPDWSVRATGPAAALAKLRVHVEGHRLQIDRRDERDRPDWKLEQQVRFTVTLPRLNELALGGSGRLLADRVSGNRFEASLGGSGQIEVGQLAVDDTTLSIGGSGRVAVAGVTRTLTASIGGSGDIAAAGLRAQTATVSSAGSGSIRATVDGPADVSSVGSGAIDLGRSARCQVTKRGSGAVHCGS